MEDSKSLKVEVVSRETIKPSSPSPNPNHHQGSFKLSLLDQFSANFYVPALLFYKTTSPPPGGGEIELNQISQLLKSSLSETLTRFYPFSGRLDEDSFAINYNDEGVDFLEARVLNFSLFDVLEKPNPKHLKKLLVPDESPDSTTTRPLFLVQASFFECGGMSLGMKCYHKIADAATLASFVNSWSDSALGNAKPLIIPDFRASTVFPPSYLPSPSAAKKPPNQNKPKPVIRTGRFVFGPSQLAVLQAKATSTKNPQPSRFEAVSAFLWRIVMLSKEELANPEWKKKPSKLTWAVNLRSKLQPPLPEHCFGNLVGQAVQEVQVDGKDLASLAGQIRRGTIDICDKFVQALEGDESSDVGTFELQMCTRNLYDEAIVGTIDLCMVSSWCKLPLYEADFGWGKPLWVTTGGLLQIPNMIMLMDTRYGRGIEVWVSLIEEVMAVFETNQELQKYASFNPALCL